MLAPSSIASSDELAELASLYLLREDMTFLNHGSFGACPRPVFEVYQAWQRELELQPVDFLTRRLKRLLADARLKLAGFVGTEAGNLVFVPNATFGVNVVARSLELHPGDEVLSTNHEYGAVDRAWRYHCQRRGARYINHPISLPLERADTFVEQLWTGVTQRTRVIALSHITSPTAAIFPVAEVCRRARAAGILTVVDGAHAPGQVDLLLDELWADFYVGNCHKWLSAPKGAAFLFARPERQELLEPLIVGWGWQSDTPGLSPFIDYFDWTGTQDPAAYLSVPAAIDFQREHDWPRVRAACHELAGAARERIAELTGLPQISPDSEEWWSQMCAIPLPPSDREKFDGRLWNDFGIEIPIISWNDWLFVRVSIQAYNRPQDIDRLIEALARILGKA
jgi:isopenicillin-N epimerase